VYRFEKLNLFFNDIQGIAKMMQFFRIAEPQNFKAAPALAPTLLQASQLLFK
jgi:hypothetical protein